jgi:hypothetical protein
MQMEDFLAVANIMLVTAILGAGVVLCVVVFFVVLALLVHYA